MLSSLWKTQINLAHLTAHRGVLGPFSATGVSRSLPKRSKPENGALEALFGDRGGAVVKVLCYKSEGRWFHPRWCHWKFSLT